MVMFISDVRIWSAFYFENFELQNHGVTHYKVDSYITQIPWKTVISALLTAGDICVYQRISALGIRYGTLGCNTQTPALCEVKNCMYYLQ